MDSETTRPTRTDNHALTTISRGNANLDIVPLEKARNGDEKHAYLVRVLCITASTGVIGGRVAARGPVIHGWSEVQFPRRVSHGSTDQTPNCSDKEDTPRKRGKISTNIPEKTDDRVAPEEERTYPELLNRAIVARASVASVEVDARNVDGGQVGKRNSGNRASRFPRDVP
jgi:hypothetical protein